MNAILVEDFKIINKYIDKSALMNSKWFITGSTGMLGSYFVSFLSWLNENELNNSLTMTLTHRSKSIKDDANIGYLTNKKYINFVQVDLSSEFEAIKYHGEYDYVVHAASNAAPRIYLEDPVGTINTNVRATQILLESLKKSKKLKAFMYVSSGEVYGNPPMEAVPTPESYIGVTDNLSNRSCYVESKRFAETICWNYYKHYGMPVRIIRPVHLYGPGFRENDSRVWADFIMKAVNARDIEILGDGLSRRGFCYLADAVVQILLVLLHGENGEVYNIGSDKHISIKELADVIASLTNDTVSVKIKNDLPDYLKGSPQISCPSVEKVSSLSKLHYTTIKTGLDRTMKWYNIKLKGEYDE
ncbi:hypothetical protein CDQ84_03690 [Clostridium thermosuccinogenes]|uniref:NAD-dependent epimerase/dehydratase domain-containing protein n=1 Tax=Clostridium thermosuccinogenes TaxID=84032 RepID=A0A2K2FQE1_9CLOT|nr:NAD-dependent epimerase/dehydratase family protein [Pseudoclostridium thermosuccinogenes]AUS95094.1 hypothetical protein CDO33_00690 [Pseudoclostridium thermosuccinogenes]PNT99186.1 hypothetical protein CDQ85_03690 [Pseudoclostridium thermosuccinogenes]PNU00989.1 hypothetical protein CDQ84_03690 [Pseudoclostridium thermosuccinogenes]